jgi:predicted oxidoreductase
MDKDKSEQLTRSGEKLPTYYDAVVGEAGPSSDCNMCDLCNLKALVKSMNELSFDNALKMSSITKLMVQSENSISNVYRILSEMNFQERNLEIRDLISQANNRSEFVYSCNMCMIVYIIILLSALIIPLIVSKF